ncbi:MAG: hypothetical protein EZS28_032982 [Streblomastix strix]|uniref:Uncharacterized protein n=1 Tax=Streblomastix strix TaxID=222440 RepID=A0A5J4UNB6_9EUKA|nr:MAG: hypothetical protein EZS28_032982 [Streblomastix strix]
MSESKSLQNISDKTENPKEDKEEKKDEIEKSKVKDAQEYKNESNLSNSDLNTVKQKSDISEDSQGMKKNEKKCDENY